MGEREAVTKELLDKMRLEIKLKLDTESLVGEIKQLKARLTV